MPIYEYECQVCGIHFERKQSVSEPAVQVCPDCGGKVRKLFFPAGIIFKGSGFYKTDYGSSSSSGSSPSNGSSSKSEPAKTDASKTEPAKTAAKTDS
jgi:putative FmdB family regulatory protein